ncbi:PTS galactosamine/N-acetylgalactosamine transporter subunit IIA [Testudinibacter aquarius]|uniref:PTS sugar transporter subunit IIA n=1 Tax=Testudinibacter aquarius TaxID=1524974 RepID=A0A4R3YE90_9PAST|nr:PTS galactosamine/N-acetylgalactosamine transporter subunit IIA [Testudinibacter aquarius]KAE9525845.1 hypothetical protein A1D24_03555 [Testudinibacter aquarius]TCV88783.1 PTS system N-acetylgalactosamine-specific IIA component [Testudinibacter aquarius]TNG93461.1 PTS sugar transporter subunit IIA [Testudinibacter aquarius]
MIGIILTGHGEFATGLADSLQMIAGNQTHFQAIPFKQNASLHEFEKSLEHAIDVLLEETDGVVIFTDILGGTPFKTAISVTQKVENIEVLCGTNLPMLIEIAMARDFESSVSELAQQAIGIGKETILLASVMTRQKIINNCEEGI